MKEYAAQCGVTYEAIRQKVDKYRDEIGEDHFKKEGRTTFLDEEAIRILDKHSKGSPIVIDSAEQKAAYKDVELQREEWKEKCYHERAEKEVYMKQLIELQNRGVDDSKYIPIEDHQKLQQTLIEKDEEIEEANKRADEAEERNKELEEKNEELKKDSDELKSVAIKVSKLSSEVTEKMNEINDKAQEIVDLKSQLLEMENERMRLEEEKKRAEEESVANLNLGFFARLKKKKQLREGS